MKRILSLVLAVAFLLSFTACGNQTNEFESYKTELDTRLKAELGNANNAETLIIWNAQEQLRATSYDSTKSLEENKKIMDAIVEAALQALARERATIGDYVEGGLFKTDYVVALVIDAEGGGYTSGAQLVFDWLVSDASIKAQLSKVTQVNELYEASVLFFLSDGTFALENHYAQLMVEAKKTFSSADEESLRKETVYGTYEISMEPGEDGLYTITVTKSDSSTLEFFFNPKGGVVTGQQIFVNETYKRTENSIMPQKTIADYLTENGYLKKNSVEAAKTDYHTDLTAYAILKETNKEMLVGDIYTESVVSFTEAGKAVITNHYTSLGETISGVAEESVTGSYTVSQTPVEGTTKHLIRVELEHRAVDFYLDTATGNLSRNDLFEDEAFVSFTTAELLANSGAGYAEESWTAADGAILTDIAYGSEERNLLDVYIPENYDSGKANGVILFIHGGSWISGGKEDMANLCKKYAKMGYFTATMSHSYAVSTLSDGSVTTLLTINGEVGQAFAKLKELSDENGWNLAQAALYGYSSGCHIAYLYAYSDGNEADAPIPVKAVFGLVGCMDFRAEYWKNVSTDGPGVASIGLQDERLASTTTNPYSEDEYNAIMDTISPLAFAKKGDAVPSVVAYAMLDETLIDWYNGIALEEALNRYGISNELYLLPNSGHVTGNNPAISKQYEASVLEYLEKYMSN